jgi:hypothetical protein
MTQLTELLGRMQAGAHPRLRDSARGASGIGIDTPAMSQHAIQRPAFRALWSALEPYIPPMQLLPPIRVLYARESRDPRKYAIELGGAREFNYRQHRESSAMTALNKRITLHRSALIGMALLATGLFSATANADDYTKSFTVSGRANVRVDTNDGAVTVTTSDTKQVEFRVEYQGYTLNKSLEIESNQHGDEVELIARLPRGLHLSIGMIRRLHIEVRMPKDADLQVRTGDGSINAGSVSGTIDLHSGDGAINVSSLKGSIRLHTGDGSIDASDLDGKCDASSGDGHIRLSGRFDVLSAKSGDGSVSVDALRGSKLDSSWSIVSGDGRIDVALPGDLAANIEASSGDGHITSDIPITIEGLISKSKIHGKMNGGGSTLTIHTGDGSIHLKQV